MDVNPFIKSKVMQIRFLPLPILKAPCSESFLSIICNGIISTFSPVSFSSEIGNVDKLCTTTIRDKRF